MSRTLREPSLPWARTYCPSTRGTPLYYERTHVLEARHFSTSQCLYKKGGKAAREEKQASGGKAAATTEDPYDFADLEGDIAQAIERLKSDLSKLRAGGRFNPEVVENLRVQPEKGNNQTVRLSDLAQVIPKGRQVQIIVGEKDVRMVFPLSSSP